MAAGRPLSIALRDAGEAGPVLADLGNTADQCEGVGAAAAAAEEDAAAAAALPWGLAAENPGWVAEASAASQLREIRTWLTADPPVFCGGGTVRETWFTTWQLGWVILSPTTVEITGV
jgi:hypothetical protein